MRDDLKPLTAVERAQWIVVDGDPIDGFIFHGTFPTWSDAEGWANTQLQHHSWWIQRLWAP